MTKFGVETMSDNLDIGAADPEIATRFKAVLSLPLDAGTSSKGQLEHYDSLLTAAESDAREARKQRPPSGDGVDAAPSQGFTPAAKLATLDSCIVPSVENEGCGNDEQRCSRAGRVWPDF